MGSISFAGLFVMLLGSGATDLLDVVHTDSYWKAKQVTVSYEQLVADAQGVNAVNADPAAPAQGVVRRLMAIRTLGEMHRAEAVAILQPLTAAKEPFVGDYAKAAIGAIQGKAVGREAASAAARMGDVWLIPSQVDVVGQLVPAGKPIVGGDMFGDLALPEGINKADMYEKMTASILPVVEAVGNVRLRAVTVGFFANAPGKPGYVVVVAQGEYDAKAAAATLAQHQMTAANVDGTDVYSIDRSVGLILASDERAVLVAGDGGGAPPYEAVVAAIKKGSGGLHENAEMTKLIGSVDTTQAVWAVMKVSEGIRPFIGPVADFDTVAVVMSHVEDVLNLTVRGVSPDPEKAKQMVDMATTHLQQAIAQIREGAQQIPALKPMVEAMESVKLDVDGGTVTATGSLKGPISLPLMLMSVRSTAAPNGAPAAQLGKPAGL